MGLVKKEKKKGTLKKCTILKLLQIVKATHPHQAIGALFRCSQFIYHSLSKRRHRRLNSGRVGPTGMHGGKVNAGIVTSIALGHYYLLMKQTKS